MKALAAALVLSLCVAACEAARTSREAQVDGPGRSDRVARVEAGQSADDDPEAGARLGSSTGSSDRRTGWPLHGRDAWEQRYSPLDEIDETTIPALALAWTTATGTTRGMEATPLVQGGVRSESVV